ncbi:MAG: AAA family ATPase [Chlorobiaceae bacterium]|nr:AAA family ATPase [Chlorobiaceae bacterium]NTV61664.1 AAA family ATPase [Chlorobiaceae bacterium]
MDPLSRALSHPEAYPHPTGPIALVETHISRIFLAGAWAYKLKKPVNLGFLDFSTLEKRKHYCHEELRLNRRLCPEIYHSVVPVIRSGGEYFLATEEKEGLIVDYAVKMVRFDRSMELDRMLSKKLLSKELVENISGIIAFFHKSIPPAPEKSPFGHPDIIIEPVLANFTHTEEITSDEKEIIRLERLKRWTLEEHKRLYPLFLLRKSGGFVRQCHGDMHTGNMVLWKERICIFDCIEFNDVLSIIDVMSDLAFLFMDLKHGEEPGLAWRLLNSYLFETGDYAALPLLGFYTVYRAMVRAKVTAIRYAQTTGENPDKKILEEHRSYVRLAERCICRSKPMLVITCGVSGSGKTTVSAEIASRLECLHIRSDIERKRIAGMAPLERSKRESKSALYSQTSSDTTYRRLAEIAAGALNEGIPVIVDATFLERDKRTIFRDIAAVMQCPYRIVRCHAPEIKLAERVKKRLEENRDASEADGAVLRRQLEKDTVFSDEEKSVTTEIDTGTTVDYAALVRKLKTGLS